jgi:dihydropteroate synthase
MGRTLTFDSRRTLIMGILNVTPDSFFDGGRFLDPARAVERSLEMVEQGADIIDIGGESTRPGAEAVPEEEELRRVLPVIERLAGRVETPLSIDTSKPAVARKCLALGASLINDVTGLRDPEMIAAALDYHAGIVIMHMRGTPQTMQQQTHYQDVVAEVKQYLTAKAETARSAGLRPIILDPGIGFAKTAAQSFEILRRLEEFRDLGYPVLVGPSRKSFLGSLPGAAPPEQRLEAGLAAVTIAALKGASIVRVHDVKECRRALDVVEAVRAA